MERWAVDTTGDSVSLFDLTPITSEQIQKNQAMGSGETIRKLSQRGPGPGVWRTVRHKPWWMLLGKGPDGKQCKDCEFLLRRKSVKTYFKCRKAKITRGPGTDIGARDEVCRLFEPK